MDKNGLFRRCAWLCVPVILLAACKHPIELHGEGDVFSASGARDCALEDYLAGAEACASNLVTGDYAETYTAVPRPGWQFRRWDIYCTTALDNTCSFNIGADVVQQFSGSTVPPLKAIFRSTTNDGFNALFIGNHTLVPFSGGFGAHAASAGYSAHTTSVFSAPGAQGAPKALWDNAVSRAAIQTVLDSGAIELLGMAYDPAHPEGAAYVKWVKYALQRHPDTRIFIATPWSPDPEGASSAAYLASHASLHGKVHDLIDALRKRFPGVDFYCLPSGQAAAELHSLQTAGNLPDVTALVGDASDSVFADTAGSAGELLLELGELLWLSAIYDVDLNDYPYNPGYTPDIKALAGTILAGHDRAYDAPAEVDIDTDGDGIVDRLDSNPEGRTNILLIVADDLGYNDLAINNNNTEIDTPNMDALAQQGMRFTRHYATAVCSPARAALLTGLYPERLGFLPDGRGISPQVITLPERLREEGYSTWHIGKWHIGDLLRNAWPDYQGFDHWFGFLSQDYLAGIHVGGKLVPRQPRYQDPWLMGDTEPGAYYPGHLQTILTDKAKDVLTDLKATGEPWLIQLSYYAPHGPIQPAAEFAALYPDTDAGRFRALVNQLDSDIGQVVTHLDTLGMGQDTIVVVVSDNGGTNHWANNNAPFSGSKQTLLEGGLRTPLFIRWPQGALGGQIVEDVVAVEDIPPTLLEAAGLAVPADLDGQSFYRQIQQLEPPRMADRFREFGRTSYTVLSADARWRLVQWYSFFNVLPPPEVYDFLLDPYVAQPVNPTPPDVLASLVDSYRLWYRQVHTVATQFSPMGSGGRGVLTGMDFGRTPGHGTYTFGIGIAPGVEGLIAGQADLWDLRKQGTTVTAQFGPVLLTGEVSGVNACHSVVVTGILHRQTLQSSGASYIALSLYIDGVLAQSQQAPGALLVTDAAVVTDIGEPFASGDTLYPPVILNSALSDTSAWTLSDFSASLCDG